jgi:ankyrin repeat protein
MDLTPVPPRARAPADENDTTVLTALLCGRISHADLLRHLGPYELAQLARTCQRIYNAIATGNYWSYLSPARVTDHMAHMTATDNRLARLIPLSVFRPSAHNQSAYRATLTKMVVPWLCRHGHYDAVLALYTHVGFTVADLHPQRIDSLRGACKGGHVSIARYIVETHAITRLDLEQNGARRSLFALACGSGSLAMVDYFATMFETVAIPDLRPYRLALEMAVESGNIDVVKYLVARLNVTADTLCAVGHLLLHRACLCGHVDVAIYLIEQSGVATSHPGRTLPVLLFQDACTSGSVALIDYIVTTFGVTPVEGRENSEQMLTDAARLGRIDVVQYLTEKFYTGANGWAYVNPLQGACQNGHASVARHLMRRIPVTDVDTQTLYYILLCRACSKGYTDIVRCIVEEKHLTMDELRQFDDRLLRLACRADQLETVVYLIETLGIVPANPRIFYNEAMNAPGRSGCDEVVIYLGDKFGLDPE